MQVSTQLLPILKFLAVVNTLAFIGVLVVIEFTSKPARRRYRYIFASGVVILSIFTMLGATIK